jgi:glycosyltransferase involved in cell wall biosynthesis
VALIDPSEFTPPYDAALAEGLAAAGHRVALIGQAGGGLVDDPVLEHVGHFYGLLDTGLGRRLPPAACRAAKGMLHAAELMRLPALLRRLAVDVIHLQWAPLPVIDQLFLGELRRVAPVVLTVHDTLPYNGAAPWLMAAGMGRLIRSVDAVICHTEQGRDRLLRQGVPAAQLFVVPHGLLGPRMDAGSPVPGERIRLLQFGKIKPYKGVDVLIDAVGRLTREEQARLDVHVAGKPYIEPEALETLVRAKGLGDCIRFDFEFIDEAMMELLFARADVLVFPYRNIEASGVLMQAVAAGKPVLASRIGVFGELLEDGREGLLVPPGDPEALAGALRRLVAAPAQLTDMREAMGMLRDRLPSWEEIARRTTRIYAAAHAAWCTAAAPRPEATQEITR